MADDQTRAEAQTETKGPTPTFRPMNTPEPHNQPAQQPTQAPPEITPMSGQGPLNQNASNGILDPKTEPKKANNRKNLVLWTTETARAAAYKSIEAKRRKKESATIQLITPQPEPKPVNPRLELIQEQINLTRAVLNDMKSKWCDECERGGVQPHHRAQLIRSLVALLDQERDMLGIPKTGTLKPQSPRRSKPSISDLQPQPITPQEPAGPTG